MKAPMRRYATFCFWRQKSCIRKFLYIPKIGMQGGSRWTNCHFLSQQWCTGVRVLVLFYSRSLIGRLMYHEKIRMHNHSCWSKNLDLEHLRYVITVSARNGAGWGAEKEGIGIGMQAAVVSVTHGRAT